MKTRAYLCIVAGASLWGLIGLFVKGLTVQGFTALQIVAMRTLASAIFITPLIMYKDPQLFKIKLKDLWCFLGTGVASLTFFNFCYFNCIQSSSLAVAALLLYTAPVFVMLMSLILFRESFTPAKGIALVTTFIGCGLVTGVLTGDLNLSFIGILYGLGSGFGYALYSIFGKYAFQRQYSSWTITAYTFYFCSLAAIPLADFSHCTATWNFDTLTGIIGLSLVCAVIPYLLYTMGLEHVEAGQASILATIEPVVASVVGILAFGEALTMEKIIGIILVVGSVVALNLPQNK